MYYAIFTGGTIGSIQKPDGTFSPVESDRFRLLRLYSEAGGLEEFCSESILQILSENLEAEHLKRIAQAVERAAAEPDAEGVLVMHGTDTLAYTAAFLGYLFSKIRVPVVLVSSRAPLDDPASNGLANFTEAVRFIREGGRPGVYVSYQNLGGEPVIHYGTRLIAQEPCQEGVKSILDGLYPEGADQAEEAFPITPEKLHLTPGGEHLLRVGVYPGMKMPPFYEKTRAVLLEAFHSGTIPRHDRMRRFLTEARARDIPVFLSGIAVGARNYETIAGSLEDGVIPLYNRSPIAQFVKLWLLSDHVEDIVGEMKKNYGHETVPYRMSQ